MVSWLDILEYDRYGTDEDDNRYYVCKECGCEVHSSQMHSDGEYCKECWEELEEVKNENKTTHYS